MSLRLHAVVTAALDPAALAAFWAGLLDWQEVPDDGGGRAVADPTGAVPFRLRFVPTDQPKTTQNRAHWDLTSTSAADQAARVERVLALGGRHVDVGQSGDEGHVVLGDPEGNEVDVIEPGNGFLAGCGLLGCLASDGTSEVGRFWSAALGWPLVWDQDEETAVQAPEGGSKISWGGPPLMPREGPDRVHLDLASEDPDADAERLIGLGAAYDDERGWTDPDGNAFCVVPHRVG